MGISQRQYAVRGHLTDGHRHYTDIALNTTFLPEQFKDWGEAARLHQPISAIADMASRKGTELQCNWPQELAIKFGAKGYDPRVHCLGAWQIVTHAALTGVVDTVKTRLLDFVLKIESENPDAGEAPPTVRPVPQERLQAMVYNTFYGPVGNVAQSSNHVTQSTAINAPNEDLQRLVRELTAHLADLKLDARQAARVTQQLAVMKTEIETSDPDQGIVQQAGRTIRNLTEGVIGNFIASATQPTVWHWVQQVLEQFK